MTRPLALTMGDPAGIGPEITIKAWQKLRSDPRNAFFVIADPALYKNAKTIDIPDQAIGIFKDALPVLPIKCAAVIIGKPNENAAPAILTSIKTATKLALSGEVSGVVTNPIAKDVLYRSGFSFPGHTEFLAELAKSTKAPYSQGPVMMLSAQGLRVALVTIHMPLKDVANAISIDKIVDTAWVLNGALKIDLGISSPRIAMAGLNPHAGENGSLGHEENDILIPAAKILRAEGINISNPQSADTLFHKEARAEYDAVLVMYHDQGLIPVKSLDFYGGVNTTLGLPIIRTSPDHGTAFEIAGNGVAREDSLLAAIDLARNMAANRCRYIEGSHG
ncbi:MAG: 4-hydroxythreonine-4-phosphate dehydrogenase PdxA [Robiginitomaculum sp.]|nr:4-hydroxythreonine-4-phosphate dehydrogenase PdxA [Robiginitomaculum sp.]